MCRKKKRDTEPPEWARLSLWVQAETLYFVRKMMADFDTALAELDRKIDLVIAKFADDDAAVKAAQAEAAQAKADADAVIANDASDDAAQDAARADALGAVGSKLDALVAPAEETPEV